jgi:hypothetical protein
MAIMPNDGQKIGPGSPQTAGSSLASAEVIDGPLPGEELSPEELELVAGGGFTVKQSCDAGSKDSIRRSS